MAAGSGPPGRGAWAGRRGDFGPIRWAEVIDSVMAVAGLAILSGCQTRSSGRLRRSRPDSQ